MDKKDPITAKNVSQKIDKGNKKKEGRISENGRGLKGNDTLKVPFMEKNLQKVRKKAITETRGGGKEKKKKRIGVYNEN